MMVEVCDKCKEKSLITMQLYDSDNETWNPVCIKCASEILADSCVGNVMRNESEVLKTLYKIILHDIPSA